MATPTPALLAAGLLLACLAAATLPKPAQNPAQQQSSLRQLFKSIDQNGDQEISVAEAESYAQAALDMEDEGWSAKEAAHKAQGALDGPDEGEGVTAVELRQHLRELLQDHRVVEWVIHGLNLPQYALAFKQNAITALDFPFLLEDGGAALHADLGVSSKLHQQQILRGMKRLILGLGALPPAPMQLACSAVNKSAVQLTWQAPPTIGHPAFHKYVLQRQRVATVVGGSSSGGGSCAASPISGVCAVEERWEVAGVPDDEDCSWVDLPPSKGTFRYRLAAWSAFGHSPFALSATTCAVHAVQKRRAAAPAALALPAAAGMQQQSVAPAEMQALLAAAVAAAGGNLSAAGGAARGSGWSWSAASSAAVVALSILLKASQLRLGTVASTLWRTLRAHLARRGLAAPPHSPAASTTAPPEGGLEVEHQQQAQGGAAAGRGLRRVGTSHASLASLVSDPVAELEGLPLSQCSSQLLGSGEASRGRLGSTQQEGSGLEPAAAAEALAEAEAGEAVAEELLQAILRGAHCAHPGCHRRFDRLRDMRRRLESHYCALCQRMYCLQHTRISPHGPRGGCGLESKCACYACFAELSPSQQAAFERINRLPKLCSNGGHAAGERPASPPCPGHGDAAAPAVEVASSPPTSGAASPPGLSGTASPALQRSPSRAAAGSAARKRWHKAGKVLLALARFKAAGSTPTSPQQ